MYQYGFGLDTVGAANSGAINLSLTSNFTHIPIVPVSRPLRRISCRQPSYYLPPTQASCIHTFAAPYPPFSSPKAEALMIVEADGY